MSMPPRQQRRVGATAAKVHGPDAEAKGNAGRRVITEAMPNGATPQAYAGTVKSKLRRTACAPC